MNPMITATAVGSTIGRIHLAASERGLVAVATTVERAGFLEGLARRFGPAVDWTDNPTGWLAAALVALRDEGPGREAALLALPIDLFDRPAWDRSVLEAVRSIPRGETRSYGDIARMVGRPGAARAVGGAVGRNPIALVIPCHRVIAGDGTLGGYGGGWWGERDHLLDLKAALLAREGRIVARARRGESRGR